MPSPRVEWTSPGPVASAFFHSRKRRSIIKGPFGSGKSVTCCTKIMRHIHEQAPGPDGVRRSRWVAARNTYGELKLTTKKTWEDWFGHPQWGRIIEAAPFEHRIDFDMGDGTKVDAELIFLALDREEDIRKLLSLELTGIWFNEIREMRRNLVESADGRLGRYPSVAMGGPSWYGLLGDTNMPDEDHWIHDLAEVEKPEGWAFFRQPGGVIRSGDSWVANQAAENAKNLVPDYYMGQIGGKSQQWINVYLAANYGHIPDDGAYYAAEMMRAEQTRRVIRLIADPALPVHTAWDLGVAGNMVAWFFQADAGSFKWLDHHEFSQPGLPHAASVLREKRDLYRWTYGRHLWPHDGSSKDIGSGERRCDMMAKLGFKVEVLPRSDIGDGIEQSRRMIEMSYFELDQTAAGRNHLRRYRRKFNKARSMFLQEPEHDDHSHTADAFRTAAMGQHLLTNDPPAMAAAWAAVDKWEFRGAA